MSQTPVQTSQTQIQIQIKIKKPTKGVEVIKLPKNVYNTIRSFVESSDKLEYPWNEGVDYGNAVLFKKENRWTLLIYKNVEAPKEPWKVAILVLQDRDGNDVLHVEVDSSGDLILAIWNGQEYLEFDYEPRMDIAFTADVLFARPITLAEIIDKISEFVEIEISKNIVNPVPF